MLKAKTSRIRCAQCAALNDPEASSRCRICGFLLPGMQPRRQAVAEPGTPGFSERVEAEVESWQANQRLGASRRDRRPTRGGPEVDSASPNGASTRVAGVRRGPWPLVVAIVCGAAVVGAGLWLSGGDDATRPEVSATRLEWQLYLDPEGRFRLEVPGRPSPPESSQRSMSDGTTLRASAIGVPYDGETGAVISVYDLDPASPIEAEDMAGFYLQGLGAEDVATTVSDGGSTIDFAGQEPGGDGEIHGRAIALGEDVVIVANVAQGPADPAILARMVKTFSTD